LGYTHREVFSLLYVAAASWPAFYGRTFWKQNRLLVCTWMVSCVAMSGFTMLPAIKTEDLDLM
jgi:GPI ethanolamine phosphate transferase 1